MKSLYALAVAGAAFGASLSAANAAPAGALTQPQNVEKLAEATHGRHSTCQLGPGGWHRTPQRGVRIACRPPRPVGSYWIWRSFGGRDGWYHSRERRWR